MDFLRLLISPDFYTLIIELSIPLILASLAALITNKAGVLNINIEGSMLFSAFIGALVGYTTNSAILGVLGAILSGMVFGLMLSIFTFKLKVNHILVGIALNLLSTGLVIFLIYLITGTKGDYPSINIPNLYIPFFSDIPFIGPLIFSQHLLVYVSIIIIIIIQQMLQKTKLGLRIKAVGENDIATQSLGINTCQLKTTALLIGGALAGLAGATLSMGYMSMFNTGLIAGRGFIGIAAESIGGGLVFPTVIASVVFGFVNAIAVAAQVSWSIPYELINTLPYIVTIIGLVIYAIKKNSPKKEVCNEKSMGIRIRSLKK